MTRTNAKNSINSELKRVTRGSFNDQSWDVIHHSLRAIRDLGFDLNLTGSKYDRDNNGISISKVWTFEIDLGTKKLLYGVITAHGSGTVENPLSRYDVSAYVS